MSNAMLSIIQNQIGMTQYHWKLFFLSGSGWAFDNLFFQMIAIILPSLQKEYQLSGWKIGLPAFLMYMGAMLGNLVFGYLSDSYGRQRSFVFILLLSSMANISLSFSMSFDMVLFSTFLLGIGVGGGLPTDGNLFLESIPPNRESLLALLSCFWPVGQFGAAVLAIFLMPISSCTNNNDHCFQQHTEHSSWRSLCFATGIFSFLGFLSRLLGDIHESPSFLLSVGKRVKAYETIVQMNMGEPLDVSLQEFLQSDEDIEEQATEETSLLVPSQGNPTLYAALFTKPHIYSTLLMIFIWCFLGLGFNIFHGFLPDFLNRQRVKSPTMLINAYQAYLITSIFGIPGSFVAMIASNYKKIGSKRILLISTLATSFSLLLFALLISEEGQLISSCLEAFFSNIMYGSLYFITPLVFPVEMRGKGFGICSAVSRLVGSLAPLLTGFLLESSFQLPLFISAISLFLSFLFMFFIKFEQV